MAKSVRILHVDDDPGFTEVTAETLESRRGHFDVWTATSPNTALSRLRNRGVDCVVSDYQMPEMDGLELLNKVRTMKPALPFIMFTGRGSEEVASEAISAGVTDYLQKSGRPATFDLLVNRIQNAVDNHRNEQQVRATRTRFRLLVEEATDAIFIVADDGTVKWANPVTERLFGVTPEQLVGESAFAFVIEDDAERVRAEFVELVETDRTRSSTRYRLCHADGSLVPVDARARDLLDHPVIDGVVAYVRPADEPGTLYD